MIKCRILSTSKILFSEDVTSIDLTTLIGNMQIWENHAEITAVLEPGQVILTKGNNQKSIIEITSGFCYFAENSATILVHAEK